MSFLARILGTLRQSVARSGVARSDSELAQSLDCLDKLGYAYLPAVLSESDCVAINGDFRAFVEANREQAHQHVLATGQHSRLCNLHLQSETARNAINHPRVMSLVEAFFGARAFIVSSLYFEQSSEQAIHRDTPFFYTRPKDMFLGVWFALEDVRDDAGPLVYLAGGHKLVVEPRAVTSREEIGPAWNDLCDRILRTCQDADIKPKRALIRRGDCFVWHPQLPHGGSKIEQPGTTRRSFVFHCACEQADIYGVEEFFGLTEMKPIRHSFLPCGERRMIDHGAPAFAQNG